MIHPGIVHIYQVREYQGAPFLEMEMEYVEGKTLEAEIQEHGPLQLQNVIEIVCQICSALDYAHARNRPDTEFLEETRCLWR